MLQQILSKLRITRELKFGKGAVMKVTSDAGAESTVSISELGVLDGLTATTAEINATCDGNTATAAEITRSCDASARIVTSTATALSMTVTQHAERVVLVNTNSTVANTFTLPVATGSGAKFTIINNIDQTQGSVVVAANGTTDTISGVALVVDSTAAATAVTFSASATSDKVTFNGTTTGGNGGDIVELWDTAANVWTARVFCNGGGSLATPFAAS